MIFYTIAVDFDGVIHQYTSPWSGSAVIADPPMPGAFEWLTTAVENFIVVIHSCRLTERSGSDAQEAVALMKSWFMQHGLPADVVQKLVFWTSPGKPTAIVYIDDRGYRFEGVFPSVGDIHRKLRPWKLTQ